MEKRICWKKGMRLTDEIMRASEDAMSARIGNALVLASVGRFGLLPSLRQFQLSVNLNSDAVEVQTLDCLAVTRGGFLIDVQIDTRYTNYLEKRIVIPGEIGKKELFLIIIVDQSHWKETLDGYEEPDYRFSVVGVNSPVPDNALPIAHLVYSEQIRGWHVDLEEFVPPCLYVSSHRSYVKMMERFVQILTEIEAKVFRLYQPGSHEAFRVFWPVVQQILIDTDKNRDLMTPMSLLGNIQKFVAVFTSACHLDPYLNLSDADMLRNYSLAPYNYMDVYSMIKEGLRHCSLINEKVDKIEAQQPEIPETPSKLEAPIIPEDQLYQVCKTSYSNVSIVNNAPGATVYYSTDGSIPAKPVSNWCIRIKNAFHPNREEEEDQKCVVKLKAVLNDSESDISTFIVILHKGKGYIRI